METKKRLHGHGSVSIIRLRERAAGKPRRDTPSAAVNVRSADKSDIISDVTARALARIRGNDLFFVSSMPYVARSGHTQVDAVCGRGVQRGRTGCGEPFACFPALSTNTTIRVQQEDAGRIIDVVVHSVYALYTGYNRSI